MINFYTFLRKILIILFITFINVTVYARWSTLEEFAVAVNSNSDVHIKQDGSFSVIEESRITMLREVECDCSDRYPGYRYRYDYYDKNKVTVLEAGVVNGKQIDQINRDSIIDEVINDNDGKRQITIPFPDVQVGSEVYVKLKLIGRSQAQKNIFSRIFTSLSDATGTIKISSELPLYIKVNDPNNSLDVITDNDKDIHEVKITTTKPIIDSTCGESYYSISDYKNFTWVSVSTEKDWNTIGAVLNKGFEEEISKELPEIFKEIAIAAKRKNSEEKQIDFVLSKLKDLLSYRGPHGEIYDFTPQTLKEIARTKVGDCKDFSAAVVAILRSLGYKAQIALTTSFGGYVNSSLPDIALPDLAMFNHVIVKLIGRKGKEYWIDPTKPYNFFANGIDPRISNRYVLVLDDHITLEHTPDIDPHHATVVHYQEILMPDLEKDENYCIGKVKVLVKGESAIFPTEFALFSSIEKLEDKIYKEYIASPSIALKRKVVLPPFLGSREVKDLEIDIEHQFIPQLIGTNSGIGIKLDPVSGILSAIVSFKSDQVLDGCIVDIPSTFIVNSVFKGIKAQNIERLNRVIDSPWVYIERSAKNKNIGNNPEVEVITKVIARKRIVKNEEIKSPEYKALKKQVEQYFLSPYLIFSN